MMHCTARTCKAGFVFLGSHEIAKKTMIRNCNGMSIWNRCAPVPSSGWRTSVPWTVPMANKARNAAEITRGRKALGRFSRYSTLNFISQSIGYFNLACKTDHYGRAPVFTRGAMMFSCKFARIFDPSLCDRYRSCLGQRISGAHQGRNIWLTLYMVKPIIRVWHGLLSSQNSSAGGGNHSKRRFRMKLTASSVC